MRPIIAVDYASWKMADDGIGEATVEAYEASPCLWDTTSDKLQEHTDKKASDLVWCHTVCHNSFVYCMPCCDRTRHEALTTVWRLLASVRTLPAI